MPRTARIQSSTDYYHIMMRGNNKENIFSSNELKEFLIELLKRQINSRFIEVVAYCVMDNHVHIVARGYINDLKLSIKTINIKYAMRYNKQFHRAGHVFQDRYRSEEIEDEKYLLQVIRYVHNNPVKAGIVKNPGDYLWSSYNEYIGDNKNEIKLINDEQKETILGYFSREIRQFELFHKESDDNEYLEIKEDKEQYRLNHAQQIISEFCKERGITQYKEVIENKIYLEELIRNLLVHSKLSHRQIAELLEVNRNIVHKINLEMKMNEKLK